ncbi:MAG: hypothetical protein KGJ29_10425, partial [Hyphomicrobiales bacterium]|nr:hypothetical protein [Hyphomicrobiales bacterium]
FERSKFLKICTFNNAKLFNKTKFDNANFVNFVPDFRGASLHEATEFYGTKWPSPPEDIQSAQSQVSAYEHLRKEMDRLKRNNDEFMFLRKELRARRVLTQNLLVKFLDILYEFLSDYGSSIAKPMAWMGAILVLGTIIFCKAGLNFGTSLLFSLSNMFPFLPIGKDFIDKKELSHLSSPAEAFSIAQMVAGPILLFLLILAVRNMFKIR